jgi:2-phospho-L-lactate guanylyltransferase
MTPTERGRTYAILPVKRFAEAKARLADDLSAGTRRALTESMVTDVLMALRRTKVIDEVLVVTSEPTAEAIGHGYGATVIADNVEEGQSAAVLIGIAHAIERGATRVLLVPGDCPALDPLQLTELLDRPAVGRSVTLVPDRHGTGTNALVLVPPDVIVPAFGQDSRARHEQAAAAAGVPCAVEHVSTLLIDVDTGDDLVALGIALERSHGHAPRTRGVLRQIERTRGSRTVAA